MGACGEAEDMGYRFLSSDSRESVCNLAKMRFWCPTKWDCRGRWSITCAPGEEDGPISCDCYFSKASSIKDMMLKKCDKEVLFGNILWRCKPNADKPGRCT